MGSDDPRAADGWIDSPEPEPARGFPIRGPPEVAGFVAFTWECDVWEDRRTVQLSNFEILMKGSRLLRFWSAEILRVLVGLVSALTHDRFDLLGTPIACVDMPGAIQTVRGWLQSQDRGRTVTFTNVHMVMEGVQSEHFRGLLTSMDMNCPDGMPLVWAGRRKGIQGIARVCGPEFLPTFCAAAADMNVRHFFYGGDDGIAAQTAEMLQKSIPGFQVAGVYSPPFRVLSEEEDAEIVRLINATDPDMVWVCLGCPKQETWIQSHKDKLNAKVLLAVGMAFDVVAGVKKRAPRVIRVCGMEWLYRLVQEPRRLWRRYLVYNTLFIYRYILEAWKEEPRKL